MVELRWVTFSLQFIHAAMAKLCAPTFGNYMVVAYSTFVIIRANYYQTQATRPYMAVLYLLRLFFTRSAYCHVLSGPISNNNTYSYCAVIYFSDAICTTS